MVSAMGVVWLGVVLYNLVACTFARVQSFHAISFHKLSKHFFMTTAMGNIKDFDDNSDLKLFPSPALKSL